MKDKGTKYVRAMPQQLKDRNLIEKHQGEPTERS